MSYSAFPSSSQGTGSYPPSRPSISTALSRHNSRSSFSLSGRAPSFSTAVSSAARQHEMDAAFDEDSDEEDENAPLSRTRGGAVGRGPGDRESDAVVWDAGEEAGLPSEDRPLLLSGHAGAGAGAGATSHLSTDAEPSYDFDRDYFLPPPGSPPPGAYPENYAPTGPTPLTTTPAYPSPRSNPTSGPSRLLRSILPTHFTRSSTPQPGPRGNDGVFANVTAKPEAERVPGEGDEQGADGENGLVMSEFAQKEGPPSYHTALRDAVPPYWEHNVVAPSFGPLGSITGSGDDLLIDGLPIGNFFGFAWNLLVSLSFQFVGFLLTFVLHTTHAAKYGSQAGLGITLIQYGFYLRTRADEILSGELIPDGLSNGTSTASGSGFGLGAGSTMGVGVEGMDHSSGRWWGSTDPNGLPAASIPTFGSKSEGDAWMRQHANGSTNGWGGMGDNQPTAMEIGQANAWLSFVLMSVGWFVLLMSLGGYWRVKRYEMQLLRSQQTDASTSSDPSDPNASPSENDSSLRAIFQRTSRTARTLATDARQRLEQLRASRGRQRIAQEEELEL